MSRTRKVVVGEHSDDDLLLPRPPGVFRRFWARHPRLTDILIALWAFVLSLPGSAVRADAPAPSAVEMWTAFSVVLLCSAALVWRRSFPLTVFVIATAPSVVLSPVLVPTGHVLLAFALYAVAVYRSARACWIAFGAVSVGLIVYGILTLGIGAVDFPYGLTVPISGVVTLLIGALIGVNVGNRRRYLEALIDRSRQLAVERDQQAQLAAAAERTRIAREMHDIVSHSLTVVVALSEGAAAATSVERSRQASREAADTARGALREMRAMLGVLRDGSEQSSPLEPLEPTPPAAIVEAAQRAGYPAVLETAGTMEDVPRGIRFALGRVVQEGVTNAMRHAPHATRMNVRIEVLDEAIEVVIRNDGVPAGTADHPGGYGLRGLRERVGHVGGRMSAGATGSGSWMLRTTLPLRPPLIAPETEEPR